MLIMRIVGRQSPRLPPWVLSFFWRGHGWFFDSWPYLLTTQSLNYLSILSFDNTNARNYHAGPSALRFLPATKSIARNASRSPATKSIARNASRANNLLIMIIAVGGIVRRRRTLPPLPLV